MSNMLLTETEQAWVGDYSTQASEVPLCANSPGVFHFEVLSMLKSIEVVEVDLTEIDMAQCYTAR